MITRSLLILLLFLGTAISVNALPDGVTVPLVADRSSTDGGDMGILLSARVIVTNGTGHVFVDTSPYTQVDLQGSARIAAMVASDVLGIDQRKYDFYYIIDISSPIIGGPSAGGALTVATIAAINNWTLKPNVVMTGMINPDESIGPVGGIPYKLEAAAAKNATVFIVPQGQNTVTVRKTVTSGKGVFIISQGEEETVDVIQLGKKLNVTVKEAGTIQEAVLAFTGHEIIRPEFKGTVLTPKYIDLLEPLATGLRNESNNMYAELIAMTSNQSLVDTKAIMDRAEAMYKEKKYYAATSLFFNAMIDMRDVQWNEGYQKSADKEQYLADLINKTEKQIQLSESDLDNFKMYGVSDVEAVGAAESRITDARAQLDAAVKLNDTQEKILSLAFAHERSRTAQWWLTLATPTGTVVPEEILKDRAGWYLSQAQSINTYIQALLADTSVHSGLAGSTDEDINNAQKEMQRGYYSGAIFDSLQATVKASTTIGLFGDVDTSKKINQSMEAAKSEINQVREAGIEPTLAVSAYEYADTMTSSFDKIYQYSYAKMVAKTSLVLNSYAVQTDKTPVKPTITPFVSETVPTQTAEATKQKPRATPAFEAIAAVAVILFIRRLNKP